MAFRLIGEVLRELLRGAGAADAEADDWLTGNGRGSEAGSLVRWDLERNTDGSQMTDGGFDTGGKPWGS